MAIIATGSKTIIDISDGKSLSVYLTSSQPTTQIYDVNTGTYTPNWETSRLTITPVVYANQTRIAQSDTNLTIAWKRKYPGGVSVDLPTTALDGETISGNVLILENNHLSDTSSRMITYSATVRYRDPDTGLEIQAVAEITYTQVRTGENAQTAWITGEQVFKYDTAGSVSPTTITLTAHCQNVAVSKWQYKDAEGTWKDYPETNQNTTITGTELVVAPSHTAIWDGDNATIRLLTSNDAITDTMSIYKVKDGQDGEDGSIGSSAPVVFLTNENMTFAAKATGAIPETIHNYCNIVAYVGTQKVLPVIGTITGEIGGLDILGPTTKDDELQIQVMVSKGATLGKSGETNGEINIPVTYPVETTLKITWSKVCTGATGEDGKDGENAIVFEVWAPSGTVFVNSEGTLTAEARGYDGSTEIASGATYSWSKYESGKYVDLSDTDKLLEISGTDVPGTLTVKCVMTYKEKEYVGTITFEDKVDNYQAQVDSTGGDKFVNTVGTSLLTCRLFQNGQEVDILGDEHTYNWYRLDKDGMDMDNYDTPWKTGKSIEVTGDDVDVKTTFVCEVV